MSTLPIEIVNHILSYRGSNMFDALDYEITSQTRITKKWINEFCNKLVTAYDNDNINKKEYDILNRKYQKLNKIANPPEKKWKKIKPANI